MLAQTNNPFEHMDEEQIRALVLANPARPANLPDHANWRRAAVLIPLLRVDEAWHLLFIRRTEEVAEHKGQVAFPGGGVDPGEVYPEDTALREAEEEIGLLPRQVRVLGRLSDYYSITNFLITPVVGVIAWPFDVKLSISEVSRVFTIPLKWLADPANREQRLYTRPNGRQEWVIFYQLYDGELLWGITARIVVNFLQTLQITT